MGLNGIECHKRSTAARDCKPKPSPTILGGRLLETLWLCTSRSGPVLLFSTRHSIFCTELRQPVHRNRPECMDWLQAIHSLPGTKPPALHAYPSTAMAGSRKDPWTGMTYTSILTACLGTSSKKDIRGSELACSATDACSLRSKYSTHVSMAR